MKWNYESNKEQSTGYEEVLNKLKQYKKEDYIPLNEEGRKQMVEEVFSIYRSLNIYPITYYNDKGIGKEIQKCINKKVTFDGNVLDLKFNQGNSLCRFLFPNLSEVDVKNAKNNSMIDRFYDDHKLKRAIDFCLRFKKSVTPTEIRTALEMIGGGVATNYKPMNAKALYEKYCPESGVIYDFACGFGGRMLGALSSKNSYTYIGVEPCVETFEGLNKLGNYIEKETGRTNSYDIHCIGSEDFKGEEESVDFAFSSPPYFNLEHYSDEPTQCYNKFLELEDWFSGFVKPTITNIYNMLKHDRYYAVNIADFNLGSKRVEYVDKWIELSKEVGFEFVKTIDMKIQTRRGVGHGENGHNKKEGIFVFYKK